MNLNKQFYQLKKINKTVLRNKYWLVFNGNILLQKITFIVRCTICFFFFRLMFGSLRSLWVYVDPTAQEPCLTIDDINYDIAEDEIILESNTNEIIPTGT